MDYTAIREALAASLDDIDELQQTPYFLTNPTPPAAEVVPGPIDYTSAFQSGRDEVVMIVRVFVGTVNDVAAQKRLDGFLNDDTIKAAIEADPTLAGASSDLMVKSCSGYRQYRRSAGEPLLGAEWRVTVYPT